jgi:mannose-1-phosphate guanylyltransferase
VKTFTEKPNLELAKTFLASGDFLWNAGIFVWQVKTIIQAFEKYLPEMYDVFSAEKDKFNTPAEKKALNTSTRSVPISPSTSASWKRRIMSMSSLPPSAGATWAPGTAPTKTWKKTTWTMPSPATTSSSSTPPTAWSMLPMTNWCCLQGLDNFIVVDTPDVLLICKKEKEQEIKEYVAEVKRNKGDQYL